MILEQINSLNCLLKKNEINKKYFKYSDLKVFKEFKGFYLIFLYFFYKKNFLEKMIMISVIFTKE